MDRDRFDKFTERARKVLSLAQEEAQRFQHNYIGTEHLLLGPVREGEGIAAGVLESLGVNLEKVRTQTIQVLGQAGAPHAVSRSSFPQTHFIKGVMEVGEEWFDTFTVQLSRVLSRAEEEAQRFHQNYIGTEHLLLALIRERKGVAASVLSNLGVDLNKVRSTVESILSEKAHTVSAGLTAHEAEILRLLEQGLTDVQVAAQLAVSPYTVNKHLASIYSKLGITSRSAATRYVIELAADEARLLNHHYVGVEYFLLGLLREEKGIAAGVLESLGVTWGRRESKRCA
jgi:ATP-dependent Clp protease ATP-binding subunit ClpA